MEFNYYITDRKTPVTCDDELWHALLPSDMKAVNLKSSATTGDYFETATAFLQKNDYAVVVSAIEDQCNRLFQISDIKSIEIFIVKHGQFYHPARVDILLSDTIATCALNLAVSKEGVVCMDHEYPALSKLGGLVESVPTVYGRGSINSGSGETFNMFLANWFEGFNEFHISYDHGIKKVIVWDYDNGFYYLTESEVFDLYKKATTIMTNCYNPETFEQVQPWHHAAGDFILKNGDSGVEVKLITVRQYTPMFESCPDDAEAILEATLIFLIGLSIRMRLDRVDGVSDSVWADDIVLKAVVEGFFEALQQVRAPEVFNNDFVGAFRAYVNGVEPETIIEFTTMVAGSYHPESSDYSLVVDNIQDHLVLFSEEIKKTA